MARWPRCGRRRGICRCSTWTIALGGLLGGIFNALVAPVIFDRVVEYPLALVLACLVAPGLEGRAEAFERREGLAGRPARCPGVVFVLTALIDHEPGGVWPIRCSGVLGVMIASGLGFYACVTARRRPLRFALVVGAVLAAERPVARA